MTKDAGILVALPPDLKEWVDAQAADIGINAEIWIRMLVFAARKGRVEFPGGSAVGAPGASISPSASYSAGRASIDRVATYGKRSDVLVPYDPQGPDGNDPDAWRGSPDDDFGDAPSGVDVEALIAGRLAEADAAGLTAPPQPYEAFAPANVQHTNGGTRSLRRPMSPLYPAQQPAHLRNL